MNNVLYVIDYTEPPLFVSKALIHTKEQEIMNLQ
jgi:hypothetical protein